MPTALPKRDQILKEADALRPLIVDLTLRLCRERTVNYFVEDHPQGGPDEMPAPGMESRAIRLLEPHLGDWGIPFETHAKVEGRENLLARVGQGQSGYRRLLLLLHTDTVPAGPRSNWSFEPFEPFEKKGKLYGRGVLDNKGPLTASFAAMKILKTYEDAIPGEVVFAAVADEEVGTDVGLPFLQEEGLLDCTDAVVPDVAGEMREINIAEKGRVLLKLRSHGKTAHGMEPSKGINAIYDMARWLAHVERHELPHIRHDMLGGPTVNLGLIRGGSAPNAVADECEVTLDIRMVPGQTPEGVRDEILGLVETMEHRGSKFSGEIFRSTPPIEVSPEAPIVKKILEHAPDAVPLGTGGGTFAHDLVLQGIDAVGWAPGNEETYHQPDEEIEVDQLVTFAGRLANLAFDICSMKA